MTLDDLLADFRAAIHDEGDSVVMELAVGALDASNVIFSLDFAPIKSSTYQIYVDGALQTEGVDYTFDADRGVLTFTTAPSGVVRGSYDTYVYGDAQLRRFLANAIYKLKAGNYQPASSWTIAADNTTLSDALDDDEMALLFAQANVLLLESEQKRALRRSVRIVAGIGLDRGNEAGNYQQALRDARDALKVLVDGMCLKEVDGWRVPTGMEKGAVA